MAALTKAKCDTKRPIKIDPSHLRTNAWRAPPDKGNQPSRDLHLRSHDNF